jgi:adenylylsulfate kinase
MGGHLIIWLTGQPGSGKTTVARQLVMRNFVEWIVDGDDIRTLMPNPGYTEHGRRQNIDRAQSIAAYLDAVDPHTNVAVAVVAPYRDQREAFKFEHTVLEVYLHYDPDQIERGKEGYWVEDYEPPIDNFIEIDTGDRTLESTIRTVYRALPTFPRWA